MAKKTQKTHKGLAKVVKIRKSGSVAIQHANKNHQTTNRSNASRRKRHHKAELHGTDLKRVNTLINK